MVSGIFLICNVLSGLIKWKFSALPCVKRECWTRDAENWRRVKYCGQSMFDRIALWDGLEEAIISVIGY